MIRKVPVGLNNRTIEAVLETMEEPTHLYFSNRFKTKKSPVSNVKWVVLTGGGGMAPITSQGVAAPVYQGGGMYELEARPAFIQEKMFTTAEEVNALEEANGELRQALEEAKWDEVEELSRRQDYRREFLAAQVAFNGGVMRYQDDRGREFSIDHFVPETNKRRLGPEFKWKDGAKQDPVADISNMHQRISTHATDVKIFMNSETKNSKIRDNKALIQLFKHSDYGDKATKAFLANPTMALSQLLDIPIVLYDESYPEEARITRKVDDTSWEFSSSWFLEPGMTVTFIRVEHHLEYEEWEAEVESVDGLVATFADPVEKSFVPGRDKIRVNVPFLKKNRIAFVGERLKNGRDLTEWKDVFYGIPRKVGKKGYSEIKTDPDAIKTVLQRLGLWTFYSSKALGYIDI